MSQSAQRSGCRTKSQRPPRAPVPAVRSLPPGGSPCPMPTSSKHCAPAHPATRTWTPAWSPGLTDRLRSPPLALPPARLRLGAAGPGHCRCTRFPGTVRLTVLWQVSTAPPPPRTAFLEKLPRHRSSAARRDPSPVAQDCGQRAADAPGSFCKLPPPAGARAGAGECARGRC